MKVRPLGDKIIVKRAEAADRTDSGIFLPASAKDKPKDGKIVADDQLSGGATVSSFGSTLGSAP